MAVLLGHFEEVLNKIHDIGPSVHVSLCDVSVRFLARIHGGERQTRSICSSMHECKSSSMSLCLRAYWAAFCADVTEALRCCN